MDKDFIESYVGEKIKLTMIDDALFEGVLWFVRYENVEEKVVHSICLDSYKFEFRSEHIKNIEILK